MKVGVLTFHRAVNFGAVLQAFALQRVLGSLGVDSEVIDYRSPVIEERYSKRRFWEMMTPRSIAVILLRNGYELDNRANFMRFVNNKLKVSGETYRDHESLGNCLSDYDLFLTGSDQVWNHHIAGFDPAYFLDFVPSDRRYSYAASFGIEEIPVSLVERYRTLLQGFTGLNVRETTGRRIVRELTGRDATVGLDPTLLLDASEWETLAEPVDVKGPFVLLYMLHEDHSLVRDAEAAAKKAGVEVVYISDRLFKLRGVRTLRKLRPEQWVWLFLNAMEVYTNSFHGLAFSLNFSKKFELRYLPGRSKVNSRLRDLLVMLDVDEKAEAPMESLDWNSVEKALTGLRENSMDYLRWATECGDQARTVGGEDD